MTGGCRVRWWNSGGTCITERLAVGSALTNPAPHPPADTQVHTHLTKLITYKELTSENSAGKLDQWKGEHHPGTCVEYCAWHSDSYFSKNNKKRPVSPSSLLVFLYVTKLQQDSSALPSSQSQLSSKVSCRSSVRRS